MSTQKTIVDDGPALFTAGTALCAVACSAPLLLGALGLGAWQIGAWYQWGEALGVGLAAAGLGLWMARTVRRRRGGVRPCSAPCHTQGEGAQAGRPRPADTALACDLSALSPVRRQQHLGRSRRILANVEEVRRHPRGFWLKLAYTPERLLELAEFARDDRDCCPFIDHGVLSEAGGPLWLQLGGSSDVVNAIEADLQRLLPAGLLERARPLSAPGRDEASGERRAGPQ